MVEIGMLDLGGGTLSDREQFLDRGLVAPVRYAFVALSQRFCYSTGYGLPGGLGNGLSKTGGLRVFHIETHGMSPIL